MIKKLRYLLLFVLTFYSFTSIQAYDNITREYEETDFLYFASDLTDSEYGFTYPNGTGLMQLLHDKDENHSEKNIYIRLIHPDSTLTKFTVPLVCDTVTCVQRAYPLNDGYVFVMQIRGDKFVYGTLVDWSGQVLQR